MSIMYKLTEPLEVGIGESMPAEFIKEAERSRSWTVSLTDEIERLKTENAKLRELCADMWRLIEDLDATPYVTERQGNNPAVTWLDEDWSVHESCKKRIRELGVEADA